jgi:hypothetical protein
MFKYHSVAFFFFADLGRLPDLGRLDGTSDWAGTSSSRQLSLKLIRVESGMDSLRMSLSFRIALIAYCTLAEGTPW